MDIPPQDPRSPSLISIGLINKFFNKTQAIFLILLILLIAGTFNGCGGGDNKCQGTFGGILVLIIGSIVTLASAEKYEGLKWVFKILAVFAFLIILFSFAIYFLRLITYHPCGEVNVGWCPGTPSIYWGLVIPALVAAGSFLSEIYYLKNVPRKPIRWAHILPSIFLVVLLFATALTGLGSCISGYDGASSCFARSLPFDSHLLKYIFLPGTLFYRLLGVGSAYEIGPSVAIQDGLDAAVVITKILIVSAIIYLFMGLFVDFLLKPKIADRKSILIVGGIVAALIAGILILNQNYVWSPLANPARFPPANLKNQYFLTAGAIVPGLFQVGSAIYIAMEPVNEGQSAENIVGPDIVATFTIKKPDGSVETKTWPITRNITYPVSEFSFRTERIVGGDLFKYIPDQAGDYTITSSNSSVRGFSFATTKSLPDTYYLINASATALQIGGEGHFLIEQIDPNQKIIGADFPHFITFTLHHPDNSTSTLVYIRTQGSYTTNANIGFQNFGLRDIRSTSGTLDFTDKLIFVLNQYGKYTLSASEPGIKNYSFVVEKPRLMPLVIEKINGYTFSLGGESFGNDDKYKKFTYDDIQTFYGRHDPAYGWTGQQGPYETIQANVWQTTSPLRAKDLYKEYAELGDVPDSYRAANPFPRFGNQKINIFAPGSGHSLAGSDIAKIVPSSPSDTHNFSAYWVSGSYYIELYTQGLFLSSARDLIENYLVKYPSSL